MTWIVSPSTTRRTRARPASPVESPSWSAPPPARTAAATIAMRSRRMVRRRYGARGTPRTRRCSYVTRRSGDGDLRREVHVLDRVEQGDPLVHRPLERLAARDEAG